MSPISASYRAGLAVSQRAFERAAAQTVQAVSKGEDVVKPAAELIEAKLQVKANVTVARASNDALGKILDILA